MAARRLIAVLIMLLVVSSLAAALSPDRDSDETTSSTETTTTTTVEATDRAEVLRERIPAEPRNPVAIEATVGDQLELVVEVSSPTPVQITSLGLTDFATAGAPARFDLLLRAAGTNRVTVEGETTVARIEVSESA